jgi:hypothetical protein
MLRFAALSLALLIPTTVHAQSIVRSAKSGDWSSPDVWDTGKVPGAGSRVLIRSGHTVRYDVVSTDVIRVVHIAGTLTFAHDRDTRLDAGLIRIQTGKEPSEHGFECENHLDVDDSVPRPALEVGTPTQPIGAKHAALIRLHYVPGMDKNSCPALVCCGGRMDLHGATMPRTWLPLAATARKGDSGLVVTPPESPGTAVPGPAGWKVGDRIIITATNGHPEGGVTRRPGKRNVTVETEERVIKAIEGARISLDRPLAYEHRVDGDFRGVVGNLSRNVVVESADPNGVRGHTMYHRNSAGSISYVEFRHLGKEDVLGRYAIHYHLVGTTMRGSYVVGASIWDSHNRWITIHGTNYLVVRDCVGYQSVGHGIYLEDGSEIFNVIDRNLCVQAFAGKKLPKQALPFDDNEGAGIWWANSLNSFTNNVTCENDRYGYRFEATETPAMKMAQSVLFPDGKRRIVDLRQLPFVRFDGNESHCDGRYGFNLGEGVAGVGPSPSFPFAIRNLKIWETHYAFRPQSPSVLVENMTIKDCGYGIYHPNYDRHVYRNLHFIGQNGEPFNRGHDDESVQFGSVTVDGLTLENVGGGDIAMIQLTDDNPTGEAQTHIKNLKVIGRNVAERRAVIDLGGSAKPDPSTANCVPIYVHDYFGPGRHAKVVTVKSGHLRTDRLDYRVIPGLTGPEARAAEVRNIAFPRLLDPTDDLPPATVITHVVRGEKGMLIVRGVACDNGTIAKVTVNDVPAKATRPNFAEWEAIVPVAEVLRSRAVDAEVNIEPVPHVVSYRR